MRIILTMFIVLLLFVATAGAQQPVMFVQPVAWQVQWQPVAVPGVWVAYPRLTNIGTAILGPRWVFQPVQIVPQQPQQPPR